MPRDLEIFELNFLDVDPRPTTTTTNKIKYIDLADKPFHSSDVLSRLPMIPASELPLPFPNHKNWGSRGLRGVGKRLSKIHTQTPYLVIVILLSIKAWIQFAHYPQICFVVRE